MKRMVVIGFSLALVVAPALAGAQNTGSAVASRQRETPAMRWQAERAGMLKQVLDRARAQVRNVRIRIEIGTSAPTDVATFEKTLADLEILIETDAKRDTSGAAPALPAIAAMRLQFAQALNVLDAQEVRFDAGIVTAYELNTSLMMAARVLLQPALTRIR